MKMLDLDQSVKQDVAESEKKGLYYYVNKRKKASTSRDTSSPKAPTAQAWKDAAKTAKKEGVTEGPQDDPEDYRAHLLKTLPRMMDFLNKNVKGWKPTKKQYKAAIETGYQVMKHTGNVQQAGKAMSDELNTLHRMSQSKSGMMEGRRGYDDLRDTGFGRPERDMSDESNLLYIYKDGRVKQRMVSNTVEREARAEGFRDTPEQALKIHGIIKSKFKPGKWVQKQGTQWTEVFPFGNPDDIAETATAGATSAGNVGVGAVYKNKPPKQPKNKDGTTKNALDMDANLMTGGSIKR